MKVAHLILVHTHPHQLNRLIGSLLHPEADFYIHLDKKADIKAFEEAITHPSVVFVTKRVDVRWGAYSMVQATLNGFEEILASKIPYCYVNLLSGQDYPLQSPETIHRFLASNPLQQYMEFREVENDWQEAIPRIKKYHLVNFNIPGKFKLEALINTILPPRLLPQGMVAVGRSQWFTITLEAVRFIVTYLNEHPRLVRFFKLTWGVDEIIFQTILYNSPFNATLVNDNLRYINWSEGKSSPKTLTLKDKEVLKSSTKFFARKFNEATEASILDWLDEKIKQD